MSHRVHVHFADVSTTMSWEHINHLIIFYEPSLSHFELFLEIFNGRTYIYSSYKHPFVCLLLAKS